jgi:hypothetical protein
MLRLVSCVAVVIVVVSCAPGHMVTYQYTGQMNVQYDSSPSFSHPKLRKTAVNRTTDFAGRVKLDSLSRVWFSSFDNNSKESSPTAGLSNSMTGTFKTSPNP